MGAKRKIDLDLLASTLEQALDGILHARIVVGTISDLAAPTEALDAALMADPACTIAKRAARTALQRLRDRVGVEGVEDVLAVEDCLNRVSSASCDVAYRLGLVGRGARPRARTRRS